MASRTNSIASLEGSQVGSYRIGSEIGKGSFATVFKAHHVVSFFPYILCTFGEFFLFFFFEARETDKSPATSKAPCWIRMDKSSCGFPIQ